MALADGIGNLQRHQPHGDQLGRIGKQVQGNVGVRSRRTVEDGAGKLWLKLIEIPHCAQRDLAQALQMMHMSLAGKES